MTTTNLPQTIQSGPTSTKTFFDNYFNNPVSFPAAEIDATIAFFQKRGFDQTSAKSISIVLLNQARSESVSVFTLLGSLKSLTDVQLNQVVAQVLNSYRESTSYLGYRIQPTTSAYDARNILV
jgi:hypothetical protein